jgi:mono/diheme cytochrome c family protein
MHTPIKKQTLFVKQTPLEITAAFLAILVSAVALGGTLGGSIMMEKYTGSHAPVAPPQAPPPVENATAAGPLVAQGRHLYLMNCAHCHAPDATGDEGPDLHGVRKTDARITSMIMNGVKGEMPKFGAKFKDADVQALIAYVRSLK